VQGDLDLVLQVQVGACQQTQQPGQVLGDQVLGQGRIGQQPICGWRPMPTQQVGVAGGVGLAERAAG
jgi:hypothetical protein